MKFFISSSPHAHAGSSSAKIMWTVSASLLPAAAWSVWMFGIPALEVILGTVLFSAAFEAVSQRLSGKSTSIRDGSAVLTGLILALTLPPGLPLWICAVGAFVAIVVAKAVFGGLGQNPFNPAMTGRVFLLIAFPGPLTRWIVPGGTGEQLFGHPVSAYDLDGSLVEMGAENIDSITAATPLGLLSEKGVQAVESLYYSQELLVGQVNGSLGETSGFLLLLGGVFLLITRIVSWHIPVSFLGSVAVFAAVTNLVSPGSYAGPVFHLFTGGVMIGAWFMATDYVTSPMFPMGKIIFGIGCGVLTMVIRLWAGYPEGVSFAVLLMNATVPIIDRYTRPRKFGVGRLAGTRGGEDA